MRLGIYDTGTDSARSQGISTERGRRFSGQKYADVMRAHNSMWSRSDSRVRAFADDAEDETKKTDAENGEAADVKRRAEAAKIYEAAAAGKGNPISQMRTAPKVPYGHLAKDGVITYNGVVFVCDERTNSICLGNMEDKSQVITVTLSGGGHLKVNRNNIGDLAKAAGMFSPKDLNLIMRAIAQDTKIQSVKKEIDDMENSIGSAENALSKDVGETEEQE